MSTKVPRRLRRGELRGVWCWSGGQEAAAALEGVGADLGWHTVLLDTEGVGGRDAFLEACAEAFALPEWFGMNWDALEECLGDLDVGEAVGVVVGWQGWEPLAEQSPADFAMALDILRTAAQRWEADGVPGVVVLLGDEPVPGVGAL